MDIDNAAQILAGSILTGLALVVAIITIVVINNILHKYWKPVRMFTDDSFSHYNTPKRFINPDEMEKVPPSLDNNGKISN
jgi:hypothetical protein